MDYVDKRGAMHKSMDRLCYDLRLFLCLSTDLYTAPLMAGALTHLIHSPCYDIFDIEQ